jgi:hypothetical protein
MSEPTNPAQAAEPIERALRGALARQAAAVRPGPEGLERIRAEIERRRTAVPVRLRPAPRRFWLPALAAAAAVLVIALIAPQLLAAGQPGGSRTGAGPARPPVPPLPVYYISEQDGRWALVREFQPTSLTDPQQRLDIAVRRAVSGLAADPDYTSVWRHERVTSAAPEALDQEISGRLGATEITLTLAPGLIEARVTDPVLTRLAVQQLVWTATAATGTMLPVRIAESPSTSSRADPLFGTLSLAEPFTRTVADGDPRAPVWISSLVDGQSLAPGTVTVAGDVATGASARWILTRLDTGAAVEVGAGSVTLLAPEVSTDPETEGTASSRTRQEWLAEIPVTEPGRYQVAVATDGIGGGRWTDTRTIVVGATP